MKGSNEKKAYIYISGKEENKIYIDGDTCYELSERIPGKFQWNEAEEIICLLYLTLQGWRLPTIEELELIYKLKILEFDDGNYWSSSTYDNNVWLFDFDFGSRFDYCCYGGNYEFARAIRPFKIGE